jgi:transcriptional regulator with XRE-family HTH domain
MSKQSRVIDTLPPEVRNSLRQLGANLALSRKRRRETQQAWAQRLGVSIPTLIRLEQGDPTVTMASYATALWLMGRVSQLPEVADPQLDRGALEISIREANQRAVRKGVSLNSHLIVSPDQPRRKSTKALKP